ncbi:uncharacterized protein LOC121794549 [Salvia splendens]|uniref:uncharacterized protein LOC121794549 n=1 Tax=Salvia splendens TaxID=180675 RepID=UPI001C26F982|nr:uncharacterized protein LOC121794549 [Salvia splendens]
MVFAEPLLFLYDSDETGSSARLSFSSEFLDESNFITIFPNPRADREERAAVDFEFLSGNLTGMIAADELFSEGKLIPFQQIHLAEKLDKISLKPEEEARKKDQERRMSWFVDDDPSPRPPKCTVLWKELLKLKKPRPSTLSPPNSSSSSSSSRTSSVRGEVVKESGESSKRVKKGKERTRSFSIRIRPVLNVPICTQPKNAALPPLFSSRTGR